MDAVAALQMSEDAEEVTGSGIAARTEHAHQTFRWHLCGLAQLLEAARTTRYDLPDAYVINP
ncbi:hypothetical protein [Dongia sp. agr-C8]